MMCHPERSPAAAGRSRRTCGSISSPTATCHTRTPPTLLAVLLLAVAAAPAQNPTPLPPPKSQDQITVTATRSSSPLGATAKTTYTLTSEDLHDFPAVTLDDALRQHAGFELFRRAPSRIANPTSEGISLRGLGSTAASRTLVLLDGAPLNDPFGGYIHWSEQPSSSISSVTLVTGGGSDLYGSSALGGVIDILPTAPSPGTLDLSALGGSESTNDLTALVSRTFHPLALLAAAESLRTAGYIPTAPSLAGPVDIPANVLSQSYRTEIGRRTFASNRFFLTANLLNDARSNGTPLQTNATRFWRYLTAWDTPDSDRITARARLFGSAQGYRQSFSAINAARTSENLTRLQRVHTQEAGASADSTLHTKSFALVTGTDLRDIRATDNETPLSAGKPTGLQATSARQRFFGAFAELLVSRNHWSGAFSLRVDRAENLDIFQTANTLTTSTPTHPSDRNETILSPRLGLARTLGSHAELHASAFRAFRTPTMNELYRTGQVGQETTLPNPALLSERATGWELGATLTSTRQSLHATYFWTEINRPVSAVLLTQTATTLTDQRQNLGQIRSQGFELAYAASLTHALSTSLGYQYADSIVTKFASSNPAQLSVAGNWIPQVPRQSVTAQLRASTPRLGQFTLSARASGHTFDDANNQFPLNRFFELNLSGQHPLTRRLSATFLIQNLTNQRQQVSRTPILTLGTPIFAHAGLTLRLGTSP